MICTTILIFFSSNKYFSTIFEIFYEAHKLSFDTSTSLLGLWEKNSLVNARALLLVNFKASKDKHVPYKT